MPIKIKKPQIKPCEIKYRKSAIGAMIMTMIFAAALIFLMGTIVNNANKLAAVGLIAAYALYFAACVTSLVLGVNAYRKEDNFPVLCQCAFFLAAVIFCIMNLRFALMLIFSAFDLEDAAQALAGSQAYSEFITTQYSNWVCIIIGLILTVITGICGIVKLVSAKKKK